MADICVEPCPFCAHKGVVRQRFNCEHYFAMCPNCNACGPWSDKDNWLNAWNLRVKPKKRTIRKRRIVGGKEMKLTLEPGETLCDHELKAFIEALSAARDFDRCVEVSIQNPDGVNPVIQFELLTIEQEAEKDAKQ